MVTVLARVALVAVLLVPLVARADPPSAITFEVLHADCGTLNPRARFDFFLNDVLVASTPSSQDCDCNSSPLEVTVTDPAALALFDTTGCNRVRVDVANGFFLALAEVRVTVSPGGTSSCVFDGDPDNPSPECAVRNLCDFPTFVFDVTSIGVTDADGDGVSAGIGPTCDNCPNTGNPSQTDSDGDGFGDACDACVGPGTGDSDGDGACNAADNCPFVPNPGQADADGDGVGDACDNCPATPNADQSDANFNGIGDVCDPCGTAFDFDGDGICVGDNCPFSFNPDQADGDGDGLGDVCDNCPSVPNAGQEDGDFDGFGDACDTCVGFGAGDLDQDGRCDLADNCPTIANPGQQDRDFDGIGDACDPCFGFGPTDSDGDGFCDISGDNCPSVANPGQEDADGDGVGDACDGCVGPGSADSDADGICDFADNCVSVPNPGQEDRDSNGRGDVCDCGGFGGIDLDGDGFCDFADNCPAIANPGQENSDGDAVGDACDPCPAQFGLGSAVDSDGDGRPDSCDACPGDPSDACATVLGCTGSGETDIRPSALVRIDPATGRASFIGATGIRGCTGLAFRPGTPELYAVGRDTTSRFALWTVDVASGKATQVAPLVSSAFGAFPSDIAFRDDGTLFAFDRTGSRLARLGLDGRLSPVGFTAFVPPGGGMAFHQGTLFLATAALDTVAPASGVATVVAPLGTAPTGCSSASVVGLASDPSGVLLGAMSCSSSSGVEHRLLVAIDPVTGAVTSRGTTAAGLSAIAVAPPCGDGLLQPGEECDGGSCCSPTCRFRATGTACPDDDDPCTADTCDGAGTCRHEFPTRATCHDALPGGARIALRTGPEPQQHEMIFRWRSDSAVALGELGDPTTSSDVGLCVADGSHRLILSAKAPRGGTCGSGPCWRVVRGGLAYRDREALSDGLLAGRLRAGDAGRARIVWKGKGAHLGAMALPVLGPVTVRVVRGDSPVCFEAGFFSPTQNDEQRYRAAN